MKKALLLLVLIVFVVASIGSNTTMAAKKSSKKSSVSAAQVKEMSETVDTLTTKIYAGSLFSPEDLPDIPP